MFEKLLNQPNENNTILQYSTVEQQLEKPSEDEDVKMGLNMLKNGKAPGDDEIVLLLKQHLEIRGGCPLRSRPGE